MATKKVYPFINAKMFDLEDNNDKRMLCLMRERLRAMNHGQAKTMKMRTSAYMLILSLDGECVYTWNSIKNFTLATTLLQQLTWCNTLTSGTTTRTLRRTRKRTNIIKL